MTNVKRVTSPHSYSSAMSAGDFVFVGLHRGRGDDFASQFDNTFRNIEKTLAQVGFTVADLVKVSVWLKNIKDLPEMEERFYNYFEKDKFPTRMTSTTEFIDADCLLMIDGVAYRKSEG